MIEYIARKQDNIKKIVCNKCGRELELENGIAREDYCTVNKLWGYFSQRDGQRHRFELCEQCYEELIAGFLIPVENIEEKELI
ncbi:MAG: hypothetical protein IJW18_06335 [Lachnospiraceae bacterium]|nr:hypothetical protein [Lachnospiraceae bacterium]